MKIRTCLDSALVRRDAPDLRAEAESYARRVDKSAFKTGLTKEVIMHAKKACSVSGSTPSRVSLKIDIKV